MCELWRGFHILITNALFYSPTDVLGLEGGWIVRSHIDKGVSASEDTGSRRGVDCEILHRLEKGTSVREDAGS